MKKKKNIGLTIGLTAITTLGLLVGGAVIYNKAPTDNKLSISFGDTTILGDKDNTPTQPGDAPIVEVSELEKLCKEQKMMCILTLQNDDTIGATYTIKESATATEKTQTINEILSNCGSKDDTTVHLGWSTTPDGALIHSIEYVEGVLVLYPINAPVEDCVENAFYYYTADGSSSMGASYHYNDEFSLNFWDNAPTKLDNLELVGWVVTQDESIPELTEENILTSEEVSKYVPETMSIFMAVYKAKATDTLCVVPTSNITHFYAGWSEGEYGQETYCNQEYYYHAPTEDNKAGIGEYASTLVPEQIPEGYEFAGWSTEQGNAEAIVDFETVDEANLGELYAIYTEIQE